MSKKPRNCENCGVKEKVLEYFEYVLGGILLCEDCGDLPVKLVSKKGDQVNWVKVNGEYYPPNFPISKRS